MDQQRFGPLEDAFIAAIDGIANHDQTEELTERLLDVSNWDELLAPPTEGSGIEQTSSRGSGLSEP